MEIKVLENKKQKLVFELEGADHTLCNALKNELWNDKAVTVATYNVNHPLIAVPKFIIETKGEDAKKVLLKAIARLKKEYKDFGAAFSKL